MNSVKASSNATLATRCAKPCCWDDVLLSNTGGLTASLCQDLLPGRWLNTDIKLEGYVSPPVDRPAVDW